jgi:hypothetical protein
MMILAGHPYVDKLVNFAVEFSEKNNLIILTGYKNNGLYTTPIAHTPTACLSIHSKHFHSPQDMVYYFYLVFNCPHVEAYCRLVLSKAILSLPTSLTPHVIRQYYPHDDFIKSKSQMSKHPVPTNPNKTYNITQCGELVELDILIISSPTTTFPISHGGYRHVVLVVDVYSSFLSHVPIKTMSKPQKFIETIVTNYLNNGHPIKHIKMDNQFNTGDVTQYLDSMHITYQFAPPYEHEFIGRIERNNRTTQDKLSCALNISTIKNKKLWLYALSDAIAKLNVTPRRHLNWDTPYYRWYGTQYDFQSKPLLPFGCRVMAHNAVATQQKLSDNSTLHYYVGPAPYTTQGILLYNPKIKLVVIRRSFQPLNDVDNIVPTIPLNHTV